MRLVKLLHINVSTSTCVAYSHMCACKVWVCVHVFLLQFQAFLHTSRFLIISLSCHISFMPSFCHPPSGMKRPRFVLSILLLVCNYSLGDSSPVVLVTYTAFMYSDPVCGSVTTPELRPQPVGQTYLEVSFILFCGLLLTGICVSLHGKNFICLQLPLVSALNLYASTAQFSVTVL